MIINKFVICLGETLLPLEASDVTKNKVIRPKSRALAVHKNLGRRTDWSSQNDPQISILYLPVRVEICFDYQSPLIFGDFLQPPPFFRFLSVNFMLQQVVRKEIMEEKMQKR